jgi:hypothetical protein
MPWITTKSGKRINTDWFDEDSDRKERQIEDSALETVVGPKTNFYKTIQDRIDYINNDAKHKGNRLENCQRCIIAAEINARGYESEAKPVPKGDTLREEREWLKAFGNPVIDMVGGEDLKEVSEKITSVMNRYGQGSRAIIAYQYSWKGTSGHVICAENTKDGVVLFDPQRAKIFKSFTEAFHTSIDSAPIDWDSMECIRVDNAKLNMAYVKKAVREAGY